MKQLDVTCKSSDISERFSTNEDGCGLFVLRNGVLQQLSGESGYNSLSRIQRAIKKYIRGCYPTSGRLSYRFIGNDHSWSK